MENSSRTLTTGLELQGYMNGYGKDNVNDTISLGADIDMSGIVLQKTIGTEENPFAGVFDGRGYKISNLSFDFSSNTDVSQNIGLFGVTNGAKISNLSISGTTKFAIGSCVSANISPLVANAKSTEIKYCQVVGDVKFGSGFDKNNNLFSDAKFEHNTNFGGLVGNASDSEISYVISRPKLSLKFTAFYSFITRIGGVAGVLDNSQVYFASVVQDLGVTLDENFVGNVSIGGVAGRICQSGSSVFNVVMENTFNITNNSTDTDTSLYVGQVAGVIATPVPNTNNLAYIRYKDSGKIDRFGEMSGYTYLDSDLHDYILSDSEKMDKEWFGKQNWHNFLGEWDFDTVWYFKSSQINLQSFYGDFEEKSSSTDIMLAKTGEEKKYRYGDSVEIEFEFASIDKSDLSKGNLSKYYSLSSVLLEKKEKAKIVTTTDSAGKQIYRISSTDNKIVDAYSIVAIYENEELTGVKLTILSTSLFTEGTYSIATTSKTFSATISSVLYDDDVLQENNTPGYVFYAGTNSTSEKPLVISKMIYGQTYQIETKKKADVTNVFAGWYLDGNEIGKDRILTFTFGKQITDSCKIYAKYISNACAVTFKLDDGVSYVMVNSEEVTGGTVGIEKTSGNTTLKIFIREEYSFDTEGFVENLQTYSSDDTTKNFCTFKSSQEMNDGEICYEFSLNMTNLNNDKKDAINIEVSTEKIVVKNNTWIWILAGSVGGAFLIALIIILIVVLKRRGGGRMGGGSYSKKSYKNMYY